MKRPFFMHLFAGALALTSVLSLFLGWHLLDSYNDSRQIQSRDIKLLDASWAVFHRNEVLSMSVHMTLLSGDPKWERQYREFIPRIEAALEETKRLNLKDYERNAVSAVEEAHGNLQSIENRAFELIRQGKEVDAAQLLSGEEYHAYQQVFLTNIDKLKDSARANMDSMLRHQRGQAGAVAASVVVTLPILLISWFFVLNTIRRYLSERNRAEEALRVSEKKYRKLVESANSIILRMDAEGNVTFMNKFAQEFFGYSPEEIYGRSVLGTIVPLIDSTGKSLKALIEEVVRNPDRFESNENENMKKGGERVWVAWTNRSILDDQGQFVGILSIGNDITARKQAEEALREKAKFEQHLIDTIPSPIFYKDRRGIYRGCNKAFENYLGLTREQIVGKTVFDVAPVELAAKYFEMDLALFENPGIQVYETAVRYADGTRHDVIFTKATYVDPEGEVAGLVGVMVDITDRKRMEEALRVDEARLESLYELSHMTESSTKEIAEFALDRQVELTKSEIGFLGFMDEEGKVLDLHAWSRNVLDQCAVEDQVLHFPLEGAGLWADAVREGKPVIVNDYQAHNPEKRFIPRGHIALRRFMGVPLVVGGRTVAMVAVANKEAEYDSSDVRQITLFLDGVWKLVERRRAEMALRETERLAAIGKALSSVAHDIKTPLIAIGGFTRLVQNHLEAGHPDREKLGIVIRETHRMECMVKDMLDFSKPLQLERSPEDIHQFLAESMMVVERLAEERGVSIEICSGTSLTALVDGMRLRQVIVNLVMNAVHASPQGEVVTVNSYCDGKELVIDVVDHGPGIPPGKRDEVFAPFYTTKKEGTGLGLAIVRKIVDAHGGRIRILDNPDKGVTFRVEVPMMPDEQGKNSENRQVA